MTGHWLTVERPYPGRPKLSPSEELDVLRRGPQPEWFSPWADHIPAAPRTGHPWGYIHIHAKWGDERGEQPVWELVGYGSAEDLAWGLEILFKRDHDWYWSDVDGYLNDHDCHGVFYWLPTDPHLLSLPMGVTRW